MGGKYWNIDPIREYGLDLRGVIHVGAHVGLEYIDYVNEGLKNIMFFEPVRSSYLALLSALPEDPRVKTFNMALGNITGEVEMFIETANGGQSSSILEPGTHLQTHPKITFDSKELVKIDKLDNIDFDRSLYNVLNLDVQGYELEVLRGAENTLDYIDVIFSEVNTGEVYKGCGKMHEIDAYLLPYGIIRIHTHLYRGIGYGEAIYLKKQND